MRLKIYALLLFVGMSLQMNIAFGQNYSDLLAQNFHQKALNNPSYLGAKGTSSAWLGYRTFAESVEGAPQLLQGLVDVPITGRMAVGLNARYQRLGIYNFLNASLGYAYRIPISFSQSFSFGLSLGGYNEKLSTALLTSQVESDKIAKNSANYNLNDLSNFQLNGGFGASYVGDHLEVGLSLPQLLKTSLDKSSSQVMARAILIANLGYKFRTEDHQITPSVMYSQFGSLSTITSPYDMQITGGLEYTYMNSISLFGLYNTKLKNISAGMNYDYLGQFNIMVAYTMAGAFAQNMAATIEVGLGARFGAVR